MTMFAEYMTALLAGGLFAGPKAAEPEVPNWMLDPFGGWVGGY